MEAKLFFVALRGDERGVKALEEISRQGFDTSVLDDGDQAPSQSIAVFGPLLDTFQGSKNKYLRCSAVKLTDELTPGWARSTSFRVAVIRTVRPRDTRERRGRGYYGLNSRRGFPMAIENMLRAYTQWFAEASQELVPWNTSPADPSIAPESTCMHSIHSWLGRKEVSDLRRVWIIVKRDRSGTRQIQVNQWKVNCLDQRFVFPAGVVPQALMFISQWTSCFAREKTWAQTELSIPSLFLRLDCIVRDGKLILYEIEERPAGLGVSLLVGSAFLPEFRKVAETWPQFTVKISPRRREGTDDYLWIERIGWSQQGENGLLLVRAEPEETEFHHLEPRCVSSLIQKGNKSYGEQMGLWRTVISSEELDWDSSFVLKPCQGSKVRGIQIWDPKNRPGSSARTVIEGSLRQKGAMFCQNLYPPMETGILRFPWMIFRVFFAHNVSTGGWECLGGNWNARHNLRIHGASDAIFGPVVVE